MNHNPLEKFLHYFKNGNPYEFNFKEICLLSIDQIKTIKKLTQTNSL